MCNVLTVAFKKPQGRRTQLTISDDENSVEKIPSAQDASKMCTGMSTGRSHGNIVLNIIVTQLSVLTVNVA